MKPDKDKPWTWIKYRKGMCEGCAGNCCTMPVEIRGEDLVRLGVASEDEIAPNSQGGSRKKLAKRLMKEGLLQSYREATELFMLTQRPSGDCYYLHPITRLCTVYEKRPETCRKFPDIGPRPGYCPSNRKER